MYHGTTLSSAHNIMRTGFRIGRGRSSTGEERLMLGPGIYASPDIDKAREYAKNRKFTDGEPGAVLEVEVDMGRNICKVTRQGQWNMDTWQQQGYNSAWVPEGCGMVRCEMTEVCVKHPRSVKQYKSITKQARLGSELKKSNRVFFAFFFSQIRPRGIIQIYC